MSEEEYSLHKIDEKQYQLEKDGTIQVGMIYTDRAVANWTIDLLNEQLEKIKELEEIRGDAEKTRKRKNKEIAKYKKREQLYQRVIGGFKAYVELECNGDLWWDWNEE